MDATFIDSSALLRLIYDEGDHGAVDAALATTSAAASIIADVEIRVSVHRRYHARQIDASTRENLLAEAERALTGTLGVAVSRSVVTEALSMASKFPLRSLDAIQLASAAVTGRTQRRHGDTMRFCTADRRQAEVARELFGAGRTILLDPL